MKAAASGGGLSYLFVIWKNGLDNLSTAKLIGLLHVLIADVLQGFLGLGIQRAVGLRVALPGKLKQFMDSRHGSSSSFWKHAMSPGESRIRPGPFLGSENVEPRDNHHRE